MTRGTRSASQPCGGFGMAPVWKSGPWKFSHFSRHPGPAPTPLAQMKDPCENTSPTPPGGLRLQGPAKIAAGCRPDDPTGRGCCGVVRMRLPDPAGMLQSDVVPAGKEGDSGGGQRRRLLDMPSIAGRSKRLPKSRTSNRPGAAIRG